jgi:sulfatase modifying factor 1
MHGNVYEFCSDWYAPKLSGGRNPLGAESGWDRVYRGGAWTQDAAYCRSASRETIQVDYGDHGIGFRVAAVTTNELDE